MKISIRKKLFFQIFVIISIIILPLIVINTWFLEKFYIDTLKDQLENHYSIINAIQDDNYYDSLDEIIKIEDDSNVDIIIYDENKEIVYASKSYLFNEKSNAHFKESPLMNNFNTDSSMGLNVLEYEAIGDSTSFVWTENEMSNFKDIHLIGTLNNGNMIDLKLHISSINASVEIFNRFLLIIGFLTLILSSITAYLLSNHFTKPIINISRMTNQMKKLNFESRCEVITNDELGELAKNINDLSDELKRTIANLNDEITAKNNIDQKRRQLLSNVSHELKTPLALIQGYSEGLKYSIYKSKEDADFYLEVILDETHKMNTLVHTLLDINQIEFGDISIHKTSFNLSEFMEQSTRKFLQIFSDKQIKFSIGEIGTTIVFADINKIDQILNNFITNAINHVDENKIITISFHQLDEHMRINIFNSGPNIHEYDLDKLWDEFYKADKARSREKGGHGLGLSIVRILQELDNNKYGIENKINGVNFWFEIDMIKEE
ncbi:MAG: HAMP domain-containing protein [Clostridiales bacterium]|nr:HAMP domain-containing protein [Clostridiales bacterium]